MSISKRGQHRAVRWAAGVGVLAAFPFLASGVAQAAMAGGNPLTTTNRPDLRSVHVNNGADTAEFCFDKAIANVSPGLSLIDPDNFSLGGYRFDVRLRAATANVESTNTNCVVATMRPTTTGSGTADLTSYSYGTVDDNAVSANNGGANAPGNIGDSTANLDSTSHNGTADHTQGPDLQAVVPDVTNNRMNYVFDQPVDGNTLANGRYLFYDTNGGPHWGFPIGSSGTVVSVQFGAFPADAVSNAVQAVVIRGQRFTEGVPQGPLNNCNTTSNVFGGAVCELGGNPETISPTESVPVPGTSGLTARPVLLSASLVNPGGPSNQIDYTFSVPITAVDGDPGNLVAVLSNGQEVSATGENVISSNTVRATFATLPTGLETFQELVVKASVYGCTTQFQPIGTCNGRFTFEGGAGAVSSVNPSSGAVTRFNETGGVQVGDNAGAFATGFSTGPDARSVTFDNSTGTVTVQMDQRVNPGSVDTRFNCGFGHVAGNGCWVLESSTGTTITDHPNSAAVVNNLPFQSQVVLSYSPSDVQRAVALAIAGSPVDPFSAASTFFGDGQFGPQGTVRQVISPTASATAFLDPAKGKVSTKMHYLSKKQRAAERALLLKAHNATKHHRNHHR
jgi:hypothetical protein